MKAPVRTFPKVRLSVTCHASFIQPRTEPGGHERPVARVAQSPGERNCVRVRRVGADAMFCNEVKMPDVSAPNLDQQMQLKLATPTKQCSEITYVMKRLPSSSDPIAVLERLGSGAEKIVELGVG